MISGQLGKSLYSDSAIIFVQYFSGDLFVLNDVNKHRSDQVLVEISNEKWSDVSLYTVYRSQCVDPVSNKT